MLESLFQRLFSFLRDVDYAWQPVTPERLLDLRKTPERFGSLVRYFGLGLDVSLPELQEELLPEDLYRDIAPLNPAVSRSGDLFFLHSHWSKASKLSDYVHLGKESFDLIELMRPKLELFSGREVLDLGSGAGSLSLELSAFVKSITGIEIAPTAVQWAGASARAQGITNASFRCGEVGTPALEQQVADRKWDIVVFNPPMILAAEGSARQPHRDGGKLGIELPLLFLDFSARYLRADGSVFCFVTNPICAGRPGFFERLDSRVWQIVEKKIIDDHFNHQLYRKERYRERGIERVELCFLELKRKR